VYFLLLFGEPQSDEACFTDGGFRLKRYAANLTEHKNLGTSVIFLQLHH